MSQSRHRTFNGNRGGTLLPTPMLILPLQVHHWLFVSHRVTAYIAVDLWRSSPCPPPERRVIAGSSATLTVMFAGIFELHGLSWTADRIWCCVSMSGLLHPQSNTEDGRQALLITEQRLWNDVLIWDRSITMWWGWLESHSHSQRHIQLCANQQAWESCSQQHCRLVNCDNNTLCLKKTSPMFSAITRESIVGFS